VVNQSWPVRDRLQGAWLSEQVDGTGDDGQPVLAMERLLRLAVEVEDDVVAAADDERGRACTYAARAP
jgi:hypothetical protein